jgi:FtsP/CotA-like multicopper oxidase with cupredoxin domain
LLQFGAGPGYPAPVEANKAKDSGTGMQLKITDVAGRVHTINRKVTPAERKAAAERLKAKRAQAAARASALARTAPGTEAAAAAAAVAASSSPLSAGQYLVGPNQQLIPDYSGATANWAYSPLIDKFVDPLPGLYLSGLSATPAAGAKYIPVAEPGKWPVGCTTACDAVDYYEIELGEYEMKFHSQLPATRVRGYRQTNTTNALLQGFHYLGPVIAAKKGRPVRVKFTNKLPIGGSGNLNIPVDTTVMGSGPGSNVDDAARLATPADVLCMPDQAGSIPPACYTQNRATIHLHGGVTPWISDGTTHQWITPAGENTDYKEGLSVFNVPDMPNPGKPGSATNPSGSGSQTFYWTNDQAARLMFYHDHASGITRLNVYVGEAAGYLLRDDAEAALEAAGLIPGLLENIPLVLQEKGFVDAATIEATDPTWNWGTGALGTYTDPKGVTMSKRAPRTGDLWWPHVYQPAQNPADLSGYNATGRWNYGPWFYPPTPIPYAPVPNPYYNELVDNGQPPEMPGTPNPSWGAEAFLDTPVINGTAYPTLEVEAKPYRFRILNAGGDRFFNLQLYKAYDKTSDTTAGSTEAVACTSSSPATNCTEVKMVPAVATPGFPELWPQDGREGGVPDPATAGPPFVVIGTEGGFLPMPVVVPAQPVVWNGDPLTFNFGNVSDFSLLLGPAERADAIVDFSNMEGQTFILYNDAPAAFPALDPRNDYYTGNPDQTDTGGTVPTLPGKGPNTRTLMQIRVVAKKTPGITFDLAALEDAFTTDATKDGVFKASQDEIVVGQSAYDKAYGKTFPSTFPWWGLGTIYDSNVKFETVSGQRVTLLAENKAIHDEMGATFDDYGRMKASLGLEMPNPDPVRANFIMQGYADPPTELVKLVATPVGDPTADGTQIWRVNHNGVDTHPVHFHLFHVQLINRVGWDGAYRLPHPTELGWKDTVRISPLEDTYVALRPIAPRPETLPFKIPNSTRPLEPSLPIGSSLAFTNIDPLGNPIRPGITNQEANFGWEYVWHCHILSHEENDMMRAVVFAATPETPSDLTATPVVANGTQVNLAWTDNSATATGFSIQRARDAAFTVDPVTIPIAVAPCDAVLYPRAGCPVTYVDTSVATGLYHYRVAAANTVGSGVPGYPSLTADSSWSNTASADVNATAYLVVSPTTLAFGTQLVNTNSIVRTVALTNTGTGAITLVGISFSGPFSRSGGTCTGTILGGRTCTIGVRFRPVVRGAVADQLTITSSDAGSPHVVALTGTGVAPVAAAAPTALLFSTALNVPSAAKIVTVTNTGDAPLTINNVTRSGLNAGQFAHVSSCPPSLAPAASCTISVTFTPTTVNPLTKNATLNVVVAAPATNAAVSLTGMITTPTFTVAPSPVAFGSQGVSAGVKQMTVTILNTSTTPLRINSVTRSGGVTQFPQIVNVSCPISPATLAGGASCTVRASFNPTSAGLKTSTLNVNVAAPALSQSVPMSGTGVLP